MLFGVVVLVENTNIYNHYKALIENLDFTYFTSKYIDLIN